MKEKKEALTTAKEVATKLENEKKVRTRPVAFVGLSFMHGPMLSGRLLSNG